MYGQRRKRYLPFPACKQLLFGSYQVRKDTRRMSDTRLRIQSGEMLTSFAISGTSSLNL